jgi:hypothetical protein
VHTGAATHFASVGPSMANEKALGAADRCPQRESQRQNAEPAQSELCSGRSDEANVAAGRCGAEACECAQCPRERRSSVELAQVWRRSRAQSVGRGARRRRQSARPAHKRQPWRRREKQRAQRCRGSVLRARGWWRGRRTAPAPALGRRVMCAAVGARSSFGPCSVPRHGKLPHRHRTWHLTRLCMTSTGRLAQPLALSRRSRHRRARDRAVELPTRTQWTAVRLALYCPALQVSQARLRGTADRTADRSGCRGRAPPARQHGS